MPDCGAFVENKEPVVEQFKAGRFDCLETASKAVEGEFFRFFLHGAHFDRLAASCPSRRGKRDVPLWAHLSSQIALELHGAGGFAALSHILHCGGWSRRWDAGRPSRPGFP